MISLIRQPLRHAGFQFHIGRTCTVTDYAMKRSDKLESKVAFSTGRLLRASSSDPEGI